MSSLGNTKGNVTPGDLQRVRSRRYQLQDYASVILPSDRFRVNQCLKRTRSDQVIIVRDHEKGHCYYDGLMVCGSLWVCPVCSSRITEKRRRELETAVRSGDYQLAMVTLTLQHNRGDMLQDLLEALLDGFRRFKMGKGWKLIQDRFGVAGHVRALEFTWSPANGWHCHIHWLLFVRKDQELDVDQLKERLSDRWVRMLARHGRYASDIYGLDVRLGNQAVGDYVSKFGLEAEVTKAVTKNGKNGSLSPFQLLELAGEGDKLAERLFLEYALVTKGKKQLHWSHGMRDLLGLSDEKTDDELALQDEPDEKDEVIFWLRKAEWSQVRKQGLRLKLLEVAEEGLDPLLEFLDRRLIVDRSDALDRLKEHDAVFC